MMLCQHYACRCARAAELATMADRTGDPRLLAEAVAVHHGAVECRQPALDVWQMPAVLLPP